MKGQYFSWERKGRMSRVTWGRILDIKHGRVIYAIEAIKIAGKKIQVYNTPALKVAWADIEKFFDFNDHTTTGQVLGKTFYDDYESMILSFSDYNE